MALAVRDEGELPSLRGSQVPTPCCAATMKALSYPCRCLRRSIWGCCSGTCRARPRSARSCTRGSSGPRRGSAGGLRAGRRVGRVTRRRHRRAQKNESAARHCDQPLSQQGAGLADDSGDGATGLDMRPSRVSTCQCLRAIVFSSRDDGFFSAIARTRCFRACTTGTPRGSRRQSVSNAHAARVRRIARCRPESRAQRRSCKRYTTMSAGCLHKCIFFWQSLRSAVLCSPLRLSASGPRASA
jgi:hypothetical protein